eukprot:gene16364-biopygen13578
MLESCRSTKVAPTWTLLATKRDGSGTRQPSALTGRAPVVPTRLEHAVAAQQQHVALLSTNGCVCQRGGTLRRAFGTQSKRQRRACISLTNALRVDADNVRLRRHSLRNPKKGRQAGWAGWPMPPAKLGGEGAELAAVVETFRSCIGRLRGWGGAHRAIAKAGVLSY